jgi:4-carboxymuconolactone decarboxylase
MAYRRRSAVASGLAFKGAVLAALASLPGLAAWAQPATPSRSVWTDDYTPATLTAAVAAGKTTLIYSGGSSTAVANHVQVARYVARRVAEELANALVLPIPSNVSESPSSQPAAARDAYQAVSRAIRSGGFTAVVIIADEGAGPGDRMLSDLAERLQAETPDVRILYVTAHEERPGQGMTLNADYLRRWASRTVPPQRRKAVEDKAELLFADPEREWFRPEMIAAEDRAVVVPALGKILLEQRVSSILHQIRSQAFWQTSVPAPTPASPQNRLSAIPEASMSEPLRRALAEYRAVRPDGLGELGGAGAAGGVGAGGPNLWTVYVHLPEILGPLRELHEQVHVNPRISQKLVHFIIMIVARHWTNDIWTAHEDDSIKEGLGRDTVTALEEGRYPPNMAEDEQVTYDFCVELLQNKRVSDATYARALSILGEEAVVQTAITVSLYSYLSLAVNMAYPEAAPGGRLAPFPQ